LFLPLPTELTIERPLLETVNFNIDEKLVAIFDAFVPLETIGRAVEVGCGVGDLSNWLASTLKGHGIVLGLDLDITALREARHRAATGRISNATFEIGNVYQIPLPDSYAELVLCQNLLCVLGQVDRALEEMCRVVKPGGIIVAIEPASLQQFYDPEDPSFTNLSVDLNRAFYEGWRSEGADQCIGLRLPAIFLKFGLSEVTAKGLINVSLLSDAMRSRQEILEQLSTEAAEFDPATRRMLEKAGMARDSVAEFERKARERLRFFSTHEDAIRNSGYTRISALRMITIARRPVT